jgi:hypothetical protein
MPDFSNLLPPRAAAVQARRNLGIPALGTPVQKQSPFAAALDRAAAKQRQKPYNSPLKQRAQVQPPPHQQHRAHATTTTTTTTSTSTLSRSSTSTSTSKTSAPKTTAPPEAPQAAAPPNPTDPALPMPLANYPHPNNDNGRGMHWIPTTKQPRDIVDRFVAEAQRMGVKWVTFLNDGANIGENDYLVDKLRGAGIEPIMRLYSQKLQPIKGDITAMVQHYVGKGVHYFQPFNEPNLSIEQPDGVPSVDRYLDAWIPAARAIVRGGGLVGFGSLAPGGDKDDAQFLTEALAGLKKRGAQNLLNRGWLSMHNYTHNHPIEERADGDGFFKFRSYHKIVREALGRDLPIVGTEGGTFIGDAQDRTMAAIDARKAVEMAQQAYTYMRDQREPWNFVYSYWTIANEAGGGADQSFREHALFRHDGTVNPIVNALRALK